MVFIIIPRFRSRRVVIYQCPYCRRRERYFFSLLPLLRPEWPCRGCRRKFKIGAGCIASNWAGVFALYSMPLFFLAGVMLFAAAAVLTNRSSIQKIPLQLVGAVLIGGPVTMFLGALTSAMLGYFVGLFYGVGVTNR